LDAKPSAQIRAQWNLCANIIAYLVIALSLGLFTWGVSRGIVRPLKSLTKASERIQAGDLDFPIKIRSKDEIGQLAQTFLEMRRRLKESIEAQLEYEKQRQEMVVGISHDLKTPITAIKGYVEGILDGVADSTEKVGRYVQSISTKASDIDRLLDELILFSKLDLKTYPFSFETIDLRSFFQDCFEELRFELEEKKIWLSFNPGGIGPLLVNADRDKLKRVILNLVGNCVKYRDLKKIHAEIRFELKDEGAEVVVSIVDNGQGINAEDLPFIFDRFFRTDRARNSATGGSGLGLAIAKLIIEAHGGRIWAESQLEAGTRITFTLKKVAANEKDLNYRG
jgi:signal transduction histidine kinase